MKLGVVIDGSDQFIRENLRDWRSRYEIELFSYHDLKLQFFEGRINTQRRKYALHQFLNKNDIVFFEWAGPLLIRASHLAASAKIITRLQGWELWEFATQIQWQSVDKIILLGQPMKRHFCNLFPEAADKAIVIGNGVRMDVFQPEYKSHGGVIGMLGRLVPIKRIYEAILVLYELRTRGFDFRLRLGGSPSKIGADDLRYSVSIKYLVDKLDLNNYIQFAGQIEHAEQFLNQVDIFLSNSSWESQHVALVEAMATGCFCLGHRWDGIEDILPSENLYFTNTELIEKIIDYWNQPDEVKLRHRTQLREIASEKFDFEKINSNILAIFNNLS